MRLRIWAAAVGLAASACSRDHLKFLQTPTAPGAKTVVIASEIEGVVKASAYALDEDPKLEISVAPNLESVHLEALLYQKRIDLLEELTRGELESSTSTAGARLPMPDVRLAADVTFDDGAPAPAWGTVTQASPGIDGFRLKAHATACTPYASELLFIDSTSADVNFAVALDSRLGLIGNADFSYHLVTTTQTTTVGAPAEHIVAAVSTATGALVLGDVEGRLYEGKVNGPPPVLTLRPLTTPSGALSGRIAITTAPGGEREYYVLSRDGLIARWIHGAWQELMRFPTNPDSWDGQIAVLGPEDLLVALNGPPLFHVRGDVVEQVTLPGAIGAPLTVAQVPGVGAVAGTSRGELLIDAGNGFRLIERSPLAVFVFAITPSADGGFLYDGGFGFAGSWDPTSGFCESTPRISASFRHAMRLGRDLVVGGENPREPHTPLLVLRHP